MKKFLDNEYVIWCEFDNEFQNYLQSRCDSLEMSGIPLGICPPHLTLTFVKTDHIEQLKTITKDFFGLSPNLMIHSVAAFSIMMKNFNLLSAEIKTIVIKKCLDGKIVLRHEL